MLYTKLTKLAMKIAFQAHKDQTDKSGLPYIHHPLHLAEQMQDEYTVCTALLHDVVEDTPVTLQQLTDAGFPVQVTDALALLTHDEHTPYMEYVERILHNPIAAQVKLADLRHNSDLTRLDHVDDAARQRVEKYRQAIRLLTQPDTRDRIRGSLFGGAVGDALGYAVEFSREEDIFHKYGPGGIREYALDPETGTALISDDTQMTLFTLSALLFLMHRLDQRGIDGNPRHYAAYAYQGWLITQQAPYSPATVIPEDDWTGWASALLREIPNLYHRRAPGMTCLSALEARKEQIADGRHVEDYLLSRINNSKGCGGIMRVAPLGLAVRLRTEDVDMEGAQLAAITHSHSLGYMPAAVLTHILSRIVHPQKELTLKQIILEARDTVAELFKDDAHIHTLTAIIDLAVSLSENSSSDLENIHRLGEGWVAEETLAIAIYCSLKYQTDFSKAIIVSVNHNGDSDSTGAVTGNILGALLGYDAIEEKWKNHLELGDFILQAADRLYEAYH